MVEAPRLVLLIGEIFDGLVIEQAVDRLGVGLAVALVHLAAEFEAPIGDDEGEDDIADDRAEGDDREAPLIEPPEDRADQHDLEQRRHEAEEEVIEQEFRAANAALDRARQAAGLALEVEAQRELMQVAEGRERHLAHRALSDLGEDRVAQLGESLGRNPGDAIADDEHDRHGDERGLAGRERIDRMLVKHRHIDRGRFGKNEQPDRDDDAQPQIPGAARPEKGQQLADGGEFLREPDLGLTVEPPAPAAAIARHAHPAPCRRGSRIAIATTPAMISAPR